MPKIELDEAIDLFLKGKTYEYIGDKFNTSKQAAFILIKNFNEGRGFSALVTNKELRLKVSSELSRRRNKA